MKEFNFDLSLAIECASSFSVTASLGCSVSDKEGDVLYQQGYSCGGCKVCEIANVSHDTCIKAHIYGMTEAERFGGKYIYFCPMGFTCFVSPIIGSQSTSAKVTVGPFLMVDKDDYIAMDIDSKSWITANQKQLITEELTNIPVVEPTKVNGLSNLLFMSVGFLNNIAISANMLKKQSIAEVQGQINEYIRNVKHGDILPDYPIDLEQKLLRAISLPDKPVATALLNDLLAHIFYTSSGNLVQIKSSVHELLILVSRAVINGGANSETTLADCHKHLKEIDNFNSTDDLCFWFTNLVNKLIDRMFDYSKLRHSDVIHKVIHYMHTNYEEKLTLEQTAKAVFLSPSYLSRIFKQETGVSFNTKLNNIRIEKSKELLLSGEIRLADIAPLVGFEDQSYYTKVFKRTTGILPSLYRDKNTQF